MRWIAGRPTTLCGPTITLHRPYFRPGSSPTTAASHRSRTRVSSSSAQTSAFFPPTASRPPRAPPADSLAGPSTRRSTSTTRCRLERSQRGDRPQEDQRYLPNAQGDLAAAGRGYGRRAGATQPVRDQHHRFRDTDATMTHWRNPDVPADGTGSVPPDQRVPGAVGRLQFNVRRPARPVRHRVHTRSPSTRCWPTRSPARRYANRFFIELVNTLTSRSWQRRRPRGRAWGRTTRACWTWPGSSRLGDSTTNALGRRPPGPRLHRYDPMSRPDPVLRQLQPGGPYYSLIPLVQASFSTANPPVPAQSR